MYTVLNQIMILMFCIFKSLIGTDMSYHFSAVKNLIYLTSDLSISIITILTLHSSMVVCIHHIVLYCLHPRGKTVVFFFK